jgi:hypothetical protein
VSRVKDYLADQTEPLLAELYQTGGAVVVPATEEDRYSASYPEGLWLRTLTLLRDRWLSGPSRESAQRLAAVEAELAQWNAGAPPDLLLDYREALGQCVDEALEGLECWLSAYGIRLEWDAAGLCALPLDQEWAVAHSEGVWRGEDSE